MAEAMKVGIVGAGPVGLYAAYRLVKDGHNVVLLECSKEVAGNVRSWSFVRLFSKLELNLPPDARKTLVEDGYTLPSDEEYLTGGEFADKILKPLSEWLLTQTNFTLHIGYEVVSIGRGRLLKGDAIMAVGDKERVGKPFRVLCKVATTEAAVTEAVVKGLDVLIDASGSYGTVTGNHIGVGGMAAPGEAAAEAAGTLSRVIPNVMDPACAHLIKGKSVAVIGTGYSAITCLKNLYEAQEGPKQIYWLTRRAQGELPYSILEDDPLPQRSELAKFGNKLVQPASGEATIEQGAKVAGPQFEYIPAMAVGSIEQLPQGGMKLLLELDDNEKTRELTVDSLFSLTGFHPDLRLWSELQVHMCYASDGPMKLAQTLLAAKVAMKGDPSAAGDCLKQAAPGPQTLENPEPDFYVLGMKSYGRNSSFLMRVGYEQVQLLADKLWSKHLARKLESSQKS